MLKTCRPVAAWREKRVKSGASTAHSNKVCIAGDVKAGKRTSFPRGGKLKAGEIVVFSNIVYKSRAQRDTIMAKAMKDKRLASMMDPKTLPFDGKRMMFGGFKLLVDL